MAKPPTLQTHPKLAVWLHEEGVDFTEFGRRVGCSREAIRKACLPWSDPSRTEPRRTLAACIFEATDGAVRPADFATPARIVAAQMGAAA